MVVGEGGATAAGATVAGVCGCSGAMVAAAAGVTGVLTAVAVGDTGGDAARDEAASAGGTPAAAVGKRFRIDTRRPSSPDMAMRWSEAPSALATRRVTDGLKADAVGVTGAASKSPLVAATVVVASFPAPTLAPGVVAGVRFKFMLRAAI